MIHLLNLYITVYYDETLFASSEARLPFVLVGQISGCGYMSHTRLECKDVTSHFRFKEGDNNYQTWKVQVCKSFNHLKSSKQNIIWCIQVNLRQLVLERNLITENN